MKEEAAKQRALCVQIHGFEDHFFWLGVYDPPVKIMNRKNVILFYGKHVGEQQRTVSRSGPFSHLLSILLG